MSLENRALKGLIEKKAGKAGEAQVSRDHPDLGFGKFYDLLKADGHGWNHKRVHRVYCQMKLNKRRKYKRRVPARHPQSLSVTTRPKRTYRP